MTIKHVHTIIKMLDYFFKPDPVPFAVKASTFTFITGANNRRYINYENGYIIIIMDEAGDIQFFIRDKLRYIELLYELIEYMRDKAYLIGNVKLMWDIGGLWIHEYSNTDLINSALLPYRDEGFKIYKVGVNTYSIRHLLQEFKATPHREVPIAPSVKSISLLDLI